MAAADYVADRVGRHRAPDVFGDAERNGARPATTAGMVGNAWAQLQALLDPTGGYLSPASLVDRVAVLVEEERRRTRPGSGERAFVEHHAGDVTTATVHRLPPWRNGEPPLNHLRTVCCGRTTLELPAGDRVAWEDEHITCPAASAPAAPVVHVVEVVGGRYRTVCCGRNIHDVPAADRTTRAVDAGTCPGRPGHVDARAPEDGPGRAITDSAGRVVAVGLDDQDDDIVDSEIVEDPDCPPRPPDELAASGRTWPSERHGGRCALVLEPARDGDRHADVGTYVDGDGPTASLTPGALRSVGHALLERAALLEARASMGPNR